MAWDIPSGEPSELVVGDDWQWTASSGYDPATWTLSYALVKSGNLISITASNNGDGTHLVDVAKATTAGYTAGTYRWQAYITDGTDRHLVRRGTVTVLPNYAAGALDDRSHVKTVLDALEALIEGKATSDQASISIGDVSLSRLSTTELLDWHRRYQYLYQQELDAEGVEAGKATKNRVEVRF